MRSLGHQGQQQSRPARQIAADKQDQCESNQGIYKECKHVFYQLVSSALMSPEVIVRYALPYERRRKRIGYENESPICL